MILSAKSCLFALSFVLSFLSSVFCFALHLHGSSSSFKGAAAGINSRLSMVIYDEDGGTRNLVTSSTQILVAPFSVIRMDELEAMRKELLNKKTKTKIISRSDMIEAVDGTPFVQIAESLNYSPVYCVFDLSQGLGSEKIFAVFGKWVRKIAARLNTESEDLKESNKDKDKNKNDGGFQKSCDFIIAKSSYTIKISPFQSSLDEDSYYGDPVQIYSEEEIE